MTERLAEGVEWIAVDWGTSRLRAWAMRGETALAEASSGQGMGRLDRAGFEPALLSLIAPWLGSGRMPVIACGMVGSRQGWAEAPYRAVPCRPLAAALVAAPAADPRLELHIVPGLKQAAPPDVMRGEETQIAGFLRRQPEFDGVLCLPGTHSKWARISAGEVVSFLTCMTGDLFAAIAGHTVLRHSVGTEEQGDDAAFLHAVEETLSRPERLAARLFGLRAEALLQGLGPGAARSRLSGYLIGAELAASRAYWLGQDLAIIGAPGLAALYETALRGQGAAPRRADAGAMTLAGLAGAHAIAAGQKTREEPK